MNDETTMALTGNLSGTAARERLVGMLEEAWNSGAENLVVDLSAVTEIDFDSLTTLLSARNKFSRAGGGMTLRSVPPRIARLAELFRIQLGSVD